jgi:hypothetical protein
MMNLCWLFDLLSGPSLLEDLIADRSKSDANSCLEFSGWDTEQNEVSLTVEDDGLRVFLVVKKDLISW